MMANQSNERTSEIWKPVPSVIGMEASSLGRVRCDTRPGGGRTLVRKIISGEIKNGYRAIRVRAGRFYVHRLVCEAFHGVPKPGQTVDHINGEKTDNRPQNLEWVSVAENSRRQNRDGRGAPKGEAHPIAKLSDVQAQAIFRLSDDGWKAAEIAKLFSVSSSLVYKILAGTKRPHATSARWKASA